MATSSPSHTSCDVTPSNPPSPSTVPPKNVPWTYDENGVLLMRVHEYVDSRGRPRWAQVAKGLPGRTAQEARCRYRRISDAETRRKRGESFRNKCHTCGQTRRGHVCPGVTIASRDAKLAAARPPEPQRPVPEQAAKVLAFDKLPEVAVKSEAIVEDQWVEEELEEKLEANSEEEKPEVSAGEPLETADETKAIAALPSLQRPISMNNSQSEWYSDSDSDTSDVQLKRLPSVSAYIESFFNTSDEGLVADIGRLAAFRPPARTLGLALEPIAYS